jgi:hypothetical protein
MRRSFSSYSNPNIRYYFHQYSPSFAPHGISYITLVASLGALYLNHNPFISFAANIAARTSIKILAEHGAIGNKSKVFLEGLVAAGSLITVRDFAKPYVVNTLTSLSSASFQNILAFYGTDHFAKVFSISIGARLFNDIADICARKLLNEETRNASFSDLICTVNYFNYKMINTVSGAIKYAISPANGGSIDNNYKSILGGFISKYFACAYLLQTKAPSDKLRISLIQSVAAGVTTLVQNNTTFLSNSINFATEIVGLDSALVKNIIYGSASAVEQVAVSTYAR